MKTQSEKHSRVNHPNEQAGFSQFSFAACCVFAMAVLLGFKQFEIWDSVREFINYDPFRYLAIPFLELIENPWWIRTGIVMPSLLLSEYLPLSRESSFGLYALTILLLAIRATNRTTSEVLGGNSLYALLNTIFLLSLGWFMNGRICFAIFGAALLYQTHLRWFRGDLSNWRLALNNSICLIFMTVSTGAFYVGSLIVMSATLLGIRDPRPGHAQGQLTINSTLAFLPSLAIIIHQASLFNEKLARWHDGDYFMVIFHGPLRMVEHYVPSIPPELLLCGVLAGTIIAAFVWLGYATTFSLTQTYLFTVVSFGLACGALGWSTLLTSISGFMLAGWMMFTKQDSVNRSITPQTATTTKVLHEATA